MQKVFVALVLLVFCAVAQARPTQLEGVRFWSAPDHTRLVFDVSAPVAHKVFTEKNPDRIVIDLSNTRFSASVKGLKDTDKQRVKKIRSAKRPGGGLRIVLDVSHTVRPKSFLLPPTKSYGHRLVVDLYDVQKSKTSRPRPVVRDKNIPRDIVIAIDAGHGGEDPGAKGPRGTREKTVVLQIAKKLASLVNKEPGMRAVLVRNGDYYIGLRSRIKKARKHQADLFISIHADAFRDPSVHGSTVYAVSQRGASSEMARWLAERENASDLVGGVSLDDKNDMLRSVLLDLSQSASLEASLDVGSEVLRQLRPLGKVHKARVQQAGFLVLKSPDIPSILVETAFISNPDEERRLRSSKHQQRVAQAVMSGVRRYFSRVSPPGTRWAGKKHKIRSGETLSGIAERYRVSVYTIREVNGLSGDKVRIGQVLTIPPRSGG